MQQDHRLSISAKENPEARLYTDEELDEREKSATVKKWLVRVGIALGILAVAGTLFYHYVWVPFMGK